MSTDDLTTALNDGDPSVVARAWLNASKVDIWGIEPGYLHNALDTLADAWITAITPR